MASSLDIAIFIAAPLAAMLVMAYERILLGLDDLKDDWSTYRCNPLYMPFASLVNPAVSASDNFNLCMGMMGKSILTVPMDSVQAIMGSFKDTLSSVSDRLNIFRQLHKRLTMIMLTMTTSMMSKINTLVGSMSFLLGKSLDVLKRMATTGWVANLFAYTIFVSIKAFWNLAVSIIQAFLFAMLAISIILFFFNPVLLFIVIALLAAFAAAGGFSTF